MIQLKFKDAGEEGFPVMWFFLILLQNLSSNTLSASYVNICLTCVMHIEGMSMPTIFIVPLCKRTTCDSQFLIFITKFLKQRLIEPCLYFASRVTTEDCFDFGPDRENGSRQHIVCLRSRSKLAVESLHLCGATSKPAKKKFE